MVAMAVRHDYGRDVLRLYPHPADRCRQFGYVIPLAAINDNPTLYLLREIAVIVGIPCGISNGERETAGSHRCDAVHNRPTSVPPPGGGC